MAGASDGEEDAQDGEASQASLDSSMQEGDESSTDEDDDDDMFAGSAEDGPVRTGSAALRMVPLMRFVEESRRVSAGSVLKWALQVLRPVHRAHVKFTSFGGEITVDDLKLTPDVLTYASIFDVVEREEAEGKEAQSKTGSTIHHSFLSTAESAESRRPTLSPEASRRSSSASPSLTSSLKSVAALKRPSGIAEDIPLASSRSSTTPPPEKRSSLFFAAPAPREEVRLMDVVRAGFVDDEGGRKSEPWQGKNAFLDPQKWIDLARGEQRLRSGHKPFALKQFLHLTKTQYRSHAKGFLCACSCPLPQADEVSKIKKELHRFNIMVRKDLRALALVLLQVLLRQRLDRGDHLYTIAVDESRTLEDFTSVQPLRLGHMLPLQRLLQLCMRPAEEVEALTPPPPGKAAPLCIQRFKIHEEMAAALLALQKLVDGQEADKKYKKKSCWTRRDEQARQEEQDARRQFLRNAVGGAVRRAADRIEEEEERRRFFLLPDEEKVIYFRKKRAKEKSERNRKLRIKYLHQAAIYRWDGAEQFRWLNKAFLTTFHKTYDLKKHPTRFGTIVVDKATNKKKLDVHQARQVEDVLAPMLPVIDTILGHFNKIINRKKRNHSQADVDKDFENMFFLVAKECTEGICRRCSLMTICQSLDTAREQADEKVRSSEVLSMIPRDQLHFKIVAMEADIFLKSPAGQAYKEAFVEFEKRLALPPSMTWGRRVAYAAAVSTITKFKKQANLREIGEALAASLLAACYRQNRVRRLIANIWKKAQAELQLQTLAEEEARRQRILTGALNEGDLEGEMEFTGTDGKTKKYEMLEYPSIKELQGGDKSLQLKLDINLTTSHYGAGAGQHKHLALACVLLRRPTELPDLPPPRARARKTDCVLFPRIGLALKAGLGGGDTEQSSSVGGGDALESKGDDACADVAGDILVVLYDERQVTDHARLADCWHALSRAEGSMSAVELPVVEAAMKGEWSGGAAAPGCDDRFDVAPEPLPASIAYSGNRPLLQPDAQGVWTREGARRRAEMSLLADEGPATDVETFTVCVRGLSPHRRYRVRVALSDIFVPRQVWERNPRYRWRENHRPGFYYPDGPSSAAATLATPPSALDSIRVDSMLCDAADSAGAAPHRRGSRELYIYAGSGAVTEKTRGLLVSSVSWGAPHSGGAELLQYELRRRAVLVCEVALQRHAGSWGDELRLTPQLIEQLCRVVQPSGFALHVGDWEERRVEPSITSAVEKLVLPRSVAAIAHALFERHPGTQRLVGCVEFKVRAVNAVGAGEYSASESSRAVRLGQKSIEKELPVEDRAGVYGLARKEGEGSAGPVPGSELVVLAGLARGTRGRVVSSALLGMLRHHESQRVARPVDIEQILADVNLTRVRRAASLVSSASRVAAQEAEEGTSSGSDGALQNRYYASTARIVAGVRTGIDFTGSLRDMMSRRPRPDEGRVAHESAVKIPALERKWMVAGNGSSADTGLSEEAMQCIPMEDLFSDQLLSRTWWHRDNTAGGEQAAAEPTASEAALRGGAAAEHQELLEALATREREREKEAALEKLFAKLQFHSPLSLDKR